ncbi:MAG: hypothetical protein KatS3mg032_1877 [Cyclobacteriaceae bacterium]|nr:MAG: hypothetical protein KatS3mg032_1877 [Cyclobacteriaceae bacterium]
MMRYTLPLLLLLLTAQCSTSQSTVNLDVNRFEKQLQDNTSKIILDVRTPEEFAGGYIPGAILIDYYSSDFRQQIQKLDKTRPVYVYCAAGGRSSSAAKILAASGFTRVYNLEGGFNAWKKAGKPVNK